MAARSRNSVSSPRWRAMTAMPYSSSRVSPRTRSFSRSAVSIDAASSGGRSRWRRRNGGNLPPARMARCRASRYRRRCRVRLAIRACARCWTAPPCPRTALARASRGRASRHRTAPEGPVFSGELFGRSSPQRSGVCGGATSVSRPSDGCDTGGPSLAAPAKSTRAGSPVEWTVNGATPPLQRALQDLPAASRIRGSPEMRSPGGRVCHPACQPVSSRQRQAAAVHRQSEILAPDRLGRLVERNTTCSTGSARRPSGQSAAPRVAGPVQCSLPSAVGIDLSLASDDRAGSSARASVGLGYFLDSVGFVMLLIEAALAKRDEVTSAAGGNRVKQRIAGCGDNDQSTVGFCDRSSDVMIHRNFAAIVHRSLIRRRRQRQSREAVTDAEPAPDDGQVA